MQKCLLMLMALFTSYICPQGVNDLIPKNEAFFIQSSLNMGKNTGGYWDISGGESNIKEGAKIQVWELGNHERDRRYVIEPAPKQGFVRIHIDGIAGYLTVEDGKKKNGTRLEIKAPNNSESQNFIFRYVGNSRFKIVAENGMIIALANRSSANGKVIHMWDDHPDPSNEWCLISTKTFKVFNPDELIAKLSGGNGDELKGNTPMYMQSALSYGRTLEGYFDVPGIDEPNDGDNIQVYRLSDIYPDRVYTVIPSSSAIGFYNIAVAEDQSLFIEAENGGQTGNANILLRDINNSPGQNFYFKHLGSGRYKIYTQGDKIISLNGRNDGNKSNVVTADDSDGEWNEWYLIHAETNKPILPDGLKGGIPNAKDVVVQSQSDAKINSLAGEIDRLYDAAVKEEALSSEVIVKMMKSGNAFSEAKKVSDNVNTLHAKTEGISNAMVAFKKLPFIGAGVTTVSAGLDMGLDQLGRINSLLGGIKSTVIEPGANDMDFAVRQNILLNSQLNYLKIYLYNLKTELANTANGKNPAGYTINTAEYISDIQDVSLSFTSLNKHFKEISTNCNHLSKIEEPSKNVAKGVRQFDKSLKLADKAADKINKVLDKRFKKEIAKVKINISLRDVLSGGKVGKLFDKYVSDWVEDALKPVMSSLKIKIPSIPGADKLKDALNGTADITKKIKTNTDSLSDVSGKLTKLFRNRQPAG